MVAQVAIADDAQLTARDQHPARILEHLPGDGVADTVLLVTRRIDQHQVTAFTGNTAQSVINPELDVTLAPEGGFEVFKIKWHLFTSRI